MKTIRPIILAATILLFLEALPAEALLYLTSDPTFGTDSVTVDTSTGLGWLSLSKSVGLSYDQVLTDTQPGGLFSGYRFATEQEVMTLYLSAGIPGPGYYPLSSPSIQSLISMVGPTFSQFGYPALGAFTATTSTTPEDPQPQECAQIYASGLNSTVDYLVTGPNFILLSVNPTLGRPDMGSWLVKEVPEPSQTSIFVLCVALWTVSGRFQRKQSTTVLRLFTFPWPAFLNAQEKRIDQPSRQATTPSVG